MHVSYGTALILKVKSMEVGEGEEHAHLVAHRSDFIARRDVFSQPGADRASALVERWKLSSCAGAVQPLSISWRDQKSGPTHEQMANNQWNRGGNPGRLLKVCLQR